jgi:organic radical activating enzyme
MNPKDHPTYCHYPFKSMTFKKWSGDGKRPTNVTPCCMMMNPVEQKGEAADMHYNMGLSETELAGMNPLDIFNSPQYEKLRNDLTNGIKNEACTVCWKMEEKGLESFRQCSDLYGGKETDGLFEFDITLSNLCNLACRMCNIGSSHQIGKDVDAMIKAGVHGEFQEASNGAMPYEKGVIYDKESNEVIDWLMNNTHQITMLKASGGEPFYDRRVVKVLEKYVEDGTAKNTSLKFHTNATQFTPELANMLNNFKEQGHTFSIDGTQSTYNYIRHNSDWVNLNNSMDHYFTNCNNIKHQYFNMVLSGINVLNAADYIEWICFKCKSAEVPDWYIHFAEMFPYNRGTALRNIPKELLEESLDRLIEVIDSGISTVADSDTVHATIRGKEYKAWYRFNIQNLVGQIQNAINDHKGDYKKFKREIVILDNVRNQSYKDYIDPLLTDHLDNINV